MISKKKLEFANDYKKHSVEMFGFTVGDVIETLKTFERDTPVAAPVFWDCEEVQAVYDPELILQDGVLYIL